MQLESSITLSFIFFLIITVLSKSVLTLLNIKYINKNFHKVPEEFSENITLDEHQKAQQYTVQRNRFSLFNNLFHTIILLLWLSFGLKDLNAFIASFSLSSLHLGVIYIIAFSFINYLISIPEGLYSTFVLEEKFGFNKTTPTLYLKDQIKQMIVGLLIGVPFLYGFLSIIYALGENWWLYAWAFLILFQILMIWAYPTLISPLFNKFTPLDNDELKEQIEELGQKAQISFKDYFVMNASLRSSHGNAYFTGLGKFKKIVFFDTLLKSLTNNEVIAVLAHELGHMKKKHILKGILISTISLFITLFVMGLLSNSLAFYQAFGFENKEPYIALILFLLISPYYTFFLTPISSWFSRRHEFEADEFASLMSNPKDLISALLKMYKDNSSSLTPHPMYSKFYYSHPPAKERIAFLSSFIKKD